MTRSLLADGTRKLSAHNSFICLFVRLSTKHRETVTSAHAPPVILWERMRDCIQVSDAWSQPPRAQHTAADFNSLLLLLFYLILPWTWVVQTGDSFIVFFNDGACIHYIVYTAVCMHAYLYLGNGKSLPDFFYKARLLLWRLAFTSCWFRSRST